jgi:two-component sensor histidine kinase
MEKFLAALPERPQPPLIRFGITAIIMALSSLVELALFHIAGFSGFFLLLPGVFLCGLLFDRASAFIGTLLGVLFAVYLMPALARSYLQALPLVLFAVTGFGFAFVSERLRKTMERLVRSERTKDMLLRELDHRTKNNMMSMASLLRMQARSASSEETKSALYGSVGRIEVMANVHDHLSPSSPDRVVNMSQYLEDLCQKIEELRGDGGISIISHVDRTLLPEAKALPLAFIVNELVTNSLKYAFPGGRKGTIDVELKTDRDVILAVNDNGVGRKVGDTPGVGTRLVELMANQLNGTVSYQDGRPGCGVTVRVPN